MQINGVARRTIGLSDDGQTVWIIDQTLLPHRFEIVKLTSLDDAARAIKEMKVRGAPLIGATAAYGVFLAMRENAADSYLTEACHRLMATRPTAVNLRWAVERCEEKLRARPQGQRAEAAKAEAAAICEEDVAICKAIGEYGLSVIRDIARQKTAGGPVQILTHCNAGWLATIDWGTATAPIYRAQQEGIDVHVWVDETRPRNQGASLTAYEMLHQGVPHTVIVDNAGGHIMQHGMVDMCLVGTDRTTRSGDVCNKIGTYLKALAASDNDVPFYVALPSTTIDWTVADGLGGIPIEQRSPDEVAVMSGEGADGKVHAVRITPTGSPCANYAFDVTPARLVTALITERGICAASETGLRGLFRAEAEAAATY